MTDTGRRGLEYCGPGDGLARCRGSLPHLGSIEVSHDRGKHAPMDIWVCGTGTEHGLGDGQCPLGQGPGGGGVAEVPKHQARLFRPMATSGWSGPWACSAMARARSARGRAAVACPGPAAPGRGCSGGWRRWGGRGRGPGLGDGQGPLGQGPGGGGVPQVPEHQGEVAQVGGDSGWSGPWTCSSMASARRINGTVRGTALVCGTSRHVQQPRTLPTPTRPARHPTRTTSPPTHGAGEPPTAARRPPACGPSSGASACSKESRQARGRGRCRGRSCCSHRHDRGDGEPVTVRDGQVQSGPQPVRRSRLSRRYMA